MTAAVLAVLLAGHLVGDWIMQTDRQAAGKTWDSGRLKKVTLGHSPAGRDRVEARLVREWWWESVRANQAHMLTYHVALVAAVAPFWWDRRLAGLVAVSWVTHSFIDRRWPVRWLMKHTGSATFADTEWGPIVVDQALHLTILLLTSTYLLGA